VGGTVGPAVSPDPVDLMSVVTIGEPMEVMSPAKVQPELNLAVRESRVEALADFFQVSTDLLSAVSEGRARMSRLFGPCAGSGGGGSFAWKGNFSGELAVSGLNGWGLPLMPLQDYPCMQAKDGVGNSNSQHTGCSDLVVFQEGDQPNEAADSGKVFWDVDVVEREGSVGSVSTLNTYANSEGVLSSYSDWAIQRANEIYPILGISFEGHNLQLLDFLSFIEEDRRLGEEGALFGGGKKGKREVKNLECSINYDARGSCSSHGKRKTRGHRVVL